MGTPQGPVIRPWAILRPELGSSQLCPEAVAAVLFMGPLALLMGNRAGL